MTSEKTVTRRRYSAEFKAQVMSQCDVHGNSVAKVAMSHGINANVVHGWRQLARERGAHRAIKPLKPLKPLKQREFVPLQMAPSAVQTLAPLAAMAQPGIEVELHRAGLSMKITWPASAAGDFAAWTRELLR
jgi:transposase